MKKTYSNELSQKSNGWALADTALQFKKDQESMRGRKSFMTKARFNNILDMYYKRTCGLSYAGIKRLMKDLNDPEYF